MSFDDIVRVQAAERREDDRAEIQQRYERHTALYIWILVLGWIAGTCLAFIVQ